jgi:tetratricopeptide (TPR) repeat protein
VSDDRLEEQFHGILRELKPGEIPDLAAFRELQRSAAGELAQALHEASGKGPILYVVDNVPEPGPGKTRRPIESWCPALGKVALLVTSRLKLLKADNLKPLAVDVLAPEAAVALLSEGIRSDLDAPSWLRIAGWVGYLPLALELLNKAMESGGVTPRELLAKVEQGPVQELDRQMEALREQIAPGALRGVTEALSLSFERLSEPAQRAALLLAWFAPDPIPLALLEALGPEVDSAAVRAALISRHFIRAAEGAPVPMFGAMHRVLADFLRSQSVDPAEELTHLCAALGEVMTQSACRDTEQWPLMNACLPHAETVLAHRKRLNLTEGAEDEVDLGLSLQAFFLVRGLASRARSLGEAIVQRASESLGAEHPETLAAMTNLAVSLCEQGALTEAEELQARVIESCERLLGAEDMVTLNAKCSLARILDAQGEPASAQGVLEEVLEPLRRQLGPEHDNVLTVLNNLGHVLSAQGQYDKARVLQEQVVEVRRRVLGSHHRETLTSLNNLASTLKDLGDTAGARKINEEVLETRLRTLGEDHPSTLNSMNNLAIIHRAERALDKAMALTERAMAGLRRTQGPEHPMTLTAMHEFANILRDQRRFAEAKEVMDRVIESSRKVLGEEHPKTLSAMSNLVGTLMMEGNLQRARGIQKRILETHLRLYGNEYPLTTIAAWTYVHIQHGLRNHNEVKKTLAAHLLWLLKRAPETLNVEQRTIRDHVMNLMGRPPRR